jgi:hypothetical protein
MKKTETVYGEFEYWEDVRRDCGYPESDNNEGLAYGLNYIDFEGEGDIYEVCWYATEEERDAVVKAENIKVIK